MTFRDADDRREPAWAAVLSWLISMLFTVLLVTGAGAALVAVVLFFPGTNRLEASVDAAPDLDGQVTSTTATTTPTSTTSLPGETSTSTTSAETTTTVPVTTTQATGTPLLAVPLVPFRVERDDTLASIAARFDLTVEELASLNQIPVENEPGIGTVLLVPGTDPEQRLVPAVLAENPDRAALIEVFQRWGEQYGAPSELLMAVAWHASQWDNSVIGPNGEVGVAQITPTLAAWIGENLVGIPLDPGIESENIQLAAAYLGWLLDETEGDTSASLAAYHDGLTSQRNIAWRDDTVTFISGVLSLRPVFDPRAAVQAQG